MISTELLRRYPLFARQEADMLKKLAMLAREKEVEAGTRLFFDGEVAKTVYILMEGSIALTMNLGEQGEQQLENLTPLLEGEVLGWSALIAPHIYTLGAQATEKSHLIAFNGSELRQLLDDNPVYGYQLIKKLAEEISHRLASKCIQLMSLVA